MYVMGDDEKLFTDKNNFTFFFFNLKQYLSGKYLISFAQPVSQSNVHAYWGVFFSF